MPVSDCFLLGRLILEVRWKGHEKTEYVRSAVEKFSSLPVAFPIGINDSSSSGIIKFLEQKICLRYRNLLRIFIDNKPKFDSAAVKNYESTESIDWEMVLCYSLKKMLRQIGWLSVKNEWSRQFQPATWMVTDNSSVDRSSKYT